MELTDASINIFRTEMSEFAKLDGEILRLKKQIKPFQEQIKLLTKKKKDLEYELCTTMEINDLDVAEVSTNKGVIFEKNIKKQMVPVTQKTVKEKIVDFFEEGPGSLLNFNSHRAKEKANLIFDYIYGKDNREYVIKKEIKSKHICSGCPESV